MGWRLKLQSEDIVRVSTAGEPGVRGYSFLARLRISQPKEMAIKESIHLQEREVIRGGWTAVDILPILKQTGVLMSVKGPFMSLNTDFHMIKMTVLNVILYNASDIKKFGVSLASGQLKIEVPVREESISHFEITCFPFVRRRRGFRRRGHASAPLHPTKCTLGVVCRVWMLSQAFSAVLWGGAGSTPVTLQKTPQNCSHQKSTTSYILLVRDVQYLRE